MATFEVQGADGSTYEVDAPDLQTAAAAVKKMAGSAASTPSTGGDLAHAIPSGAASGVALAAGTPGSIGDLAQQGVDWARRKITGKTEQQEGDEAKATVGKFLDFIGAPKVPMNEEPIRVRGSANPASTQNLRRLGDAAMGEYGPSYEPQTTIGKYAKAGTEGAVAGAMFPAGGGVGMRAAQGLTSGLGSEAVGQLSGNNPLAKAAGGVAGAFVPSMVSRAITPFPANPERSAAVEALRAEGVQPTAGQATGSRGLQYLESQLGGSATRNAMERQGEQFTSAALRRAGENAPRATTEVMDQAFARIGQQFDDLAARNVAVPDRQLGVDIGRIAQEYDQLVPPSGRAPIVANTGSDILQTIVTSPNGTISGETYQAIRSRLDRAARASVRDPQLQQALYGYRNALDDVMERSITPADQAAWREARNQYRNMIVLERAATGPGSDTAQGLISPSQLRNATVNAHGRRNYARGDGDFAELARAGEAVMKPLPDSGTAARAAAMTKTGLIAAGAATGNPLPVLAALAPNAAGHAMMTRPVQALLANQLMAGRIPSGSQAALAQALMRGSSAVQPRE
jgi:hypothetical protein